ncbi:uncharacterized protein LOC114271378 [Camellia sinensis]|uniref:uncharacterized protein LOC114271378 n=1 Tax=Camellia sinensis TaxID=4442 RepID=UPI0010366AEA|nr:uncharacterized protein LOC114271378 [Camellia sinensis]
MKCLSWNCRGLGNPRTVRNLQLLLKEQAPDMVFLMETKCVSRKIEWFRCKLGLARGLFVDRMGLSGGLALFWRMGVSVSIRNYSSGHVDAVVESDGGIGNWRFTGFYGHPEVVKKWDSWELLRRLGGLDDLPWLVVEDFNEILLPSEKLGLGDRSRAQIDAFQHALSDCSLADLGFFGPYFTWCNNRPSGLVHERLDRGVANDAWLAIFPKARVVHLTCTTSDHMPILVDLLGPQLLWSKLNEVRRLEGLSVLSRDEYGKRMQLCSEIDELLEREETLWCQRARANWLKEGDRNTSFFHSKALQRHKKKRIDGLQDDHDRWWSTLEDLERIVVGYFAELFDAGQQCDIGEVLASIHVVVPPERNVELARPYTAEEVSYALFQMHPTKAPGPDGKPTLFYQRFWPIVGAQVTRAVLGVLNEGKAVTAMNDTFIVLIPKVKSPKRMSQFRPISLCNVVYKLVSKVLANRMRKILPDIISMNQSAFVAGRLISDNMLASFEIFHFLKNKRHGKEGHFALKLDMSKAYDRVEWSFLRGVMERMGFNQLFVDTIVHCISSVSYSVLVNGSPIKKFVPTRGLRQGDPLSPYLFVLCAEGLSALIKRAEGEGKLTGVAVCRGSPRVSHLLFADDSLLFGAANMQELVVVQDILGKYELVSGQKINLEKSAICFSKNVGIDIQAGLRNAMGVGNLVDSGKYLGLPYIVGRSKRGIFNSVKDRVWTRLNGWKEIFLSVAGREILLKSVAQAIPTYIMSCFQLPDGICEDIDSMLQGVLVSNLIDEDRHCWDVNVLQENLLEMDVEAIRQIPLCCYGIPDKLVWHYTRNGLFSVRPAYHLQMNISGREVRRSGSDVQNVSWFWKQVWSLRIPNKIKVFAWKCCSNILPVKSVLRQRHILQEDKCDGCGDAAETVMHILWECMRAREVWIQSPIPFVLDHGVGGDFMGWAYGVGRRTDSVTLGLFFAFCWGLWSSRNQALFSNAIHSAAATIQMVCDLMRDFERVHWGDS